MTRYLIFPTLVVFALGLGAGWLLRRPYYQVIDDHGAAMPMTVRPTWTPPPGVTCVDDANTGNYECRSSDGKLVRAGGPLTLTPPGSYQTGLPPAKVTKPEAEQVKCCDGVGRLMSANAWSCKYATEASGYRKTHVCP